MNRSTNPLHVSHNCTLTMLDPARVKHAPWSNVEASALHSPEFVRLKSAIECLGGNIQPIKVQSNTITLLPFYTAAEPEDDRFEIAFGYSRLLACAELGLPVLALIEPLTEREAILQLGSEFLAHPNWRPWRLGQFLDRTIQGGVFSTARKAAEAFDMNLSEVAIVLDLAHMPSAVRRAHDKVNLQPAQARKLIKAFQRNEQAMTANAVEGTFGNCRTAPAVLATLTEQRS